MAYGGDQDTDMVYCGDRNPGRAFGIGLGYWYGGDQDASLKCQ